MKVLITYDVDTTMPEGAKRLRRVAKVCKDYGVRVQNSVFECLVTMAQLVMLKSQLLEIIDDGKDSLRIYKLGKDWANHIEVFGKTNGVDVTGTLIL